MQKCRKGCMYFSCHSKTCDYYLITGKRRPCAAGKDCTEYTRGRRKIDNTILHKKTANEQLAMQLADQGYSDEAIAAYLSIPEAAVRAAREDFWK